MGTQLQAPTPNRNRRTRADHPAHPGSAGGVLPAAATVPLLLLLLLLLLLVAIHPGLEPNLEPTHVFFVSQAVADSCAAATR